MLKSFLCCCCFTFHTSLSSLSFAKELLEIQKSLLTFPPCRQLCIFALGQKFKERCFNTSQALQASSTAFFNHRWHVLTTSVGLTILYQLRFCSSPVVCAVKTHEIWFVAVEQFFVFVLAAMLNYKSILLLSISVFYKVIWIGSIVNSTIKLHLELSLSRNSSVNVTVGSLHHSYQLGQWPFTFDHWSSWNFPVSVKETGFVIASRNHKTSHLRFLSTDGPLVPITASAEVFLLCPHDLLESAHIWSAER